MLVLEHFNKKLYFDETLKQSKNKIIESFVLYYGEEYRDLITRKLNNTAVICYYPFDAMLQDYASLMNYKDKELSKKFIEYLNDINYPFDKSYFEWFYFQHYLDNNIELKLVEEYLNTEKSINEFKDKYKIIFWLATKEERHNTKNIINNIDEYKKNGKFDIVKNEVLPKFKKVLEESKKYKEQFSWITEMVMKESQYKAETFCSYSKKIIEEYFFKTFNIPEIEKEYVRGCKTFSGINYDKIPVLYFFMGEIDFANDYYKSKLFMDQISDKNLCTECLIYDNLYQVDAFKPYIIKTLNRLGFHFSNNLDDYLNNEECLNTINSIKEFYELKKLKEKEALYDYLETSMAAKMIRDQFNDYHFKYATSKDYELYWLARKGTSGSCMFDVETNTNDVSPIVALDLSEFAELDHTLVHELNHAIEMNSVNNEDYVSGWTHGRKTKEKNELDMKYRWIDEVINEMITQEICDEMNNKGVSVFGKNTISSDEMKMHKCSYNIGMPLLRDFFNRFKPQIIESRLNGDINILFDKVGEENFNALNDLINKYFDEFEGISIIRIMENEDMRKKQYDYENSASSIIQQMCDQKKHQ